MIRKRGIARDRQGKAPSSWPVWGGGKRRTSAMAASGASDPSARSQDGRYRRSGSRKDLLHGRRLGPSGSPAARRPGGRIVAIGLRRYLGGRTRAGRPWCSRQRQTPDAIVLELPVCCAHVRARCENAGAGQICLAATLRLLKCLVPRRARAPGYPGVRRTAPPVRGFRPSGADSCSMATTCSGNCSRS